MKYNKFLNLWLLAVLANAFLITVPYQGMHTFDIGGVPAGYFPFILCLLILSVLSKFRIYKKYLIINLSFVGIISYGVFSLWWVVDYNSWFVYFMMWSVYILSFLFISYFISKYLTLNELVTFLRRMVFVAGLVSIVGLLRFIMGFADANPWPLIIRNGYIFFAVPLIPMVYALKDYGSLGKLSFVMVLLPVLAGIVLTFSRTGFVGICISIMGYLLYSARVHKFRPSLKLVVRISTILILFLVLLVAVPHISRRLVLMYTSAMSIAATGEIATGKLDYKRFILVSEAMRIFKEHWILGTGMGLGNYLSYFDGNISPARPHNLYLSYLAEFGLIGFLFLFIFLTSLGIKLYKTVKLTKGSKEFFLAKAFFMGHISILIMFIFHEYITAPYVWFFWAVAVGFGLIMARKKDSQQGHTLY